jgi:phage terminase large subunit-like protein
MKDLSIEYRDGKFVRLVIDGVEMKDVTSIRFSHAVGQEVPTVTVSGHVWSEYGKGDQKLEQVDKHSA